MASAEHAHATDRFAREIAGILEGQLALAAADAQAVGWSFILHSLPPPVV